MPPLPGSVTTSDDPTREQARRQGDTFHLLDAYGSAFRLRPPHTYSVGREDDVNVQIRDVQVSRLHCELRWDPSQRWVAVDLDSRNGTWLNGERLNSPRPLSERDVLMVGGQPFIYFSLPADGDLAATIAALATTDDATVERSPLVSQPLVPQLGTIGPGGVGPILEFLLSTGRTGRLEVADGAVWFERGAPIDAAFGDATGQPALQRLAQTASGVPFRFHDGSVHDRQVTITVEAHGLLRQLARSNMPTTNTMDMRIARTTQAHLLERLPTIDGYSLGVVYQAHSGVGGDFYDVGPMVGGEMLLVLGDACGHGVQAALVVSLAVKTLRMLRPTTNDPIELLVRLNDELSGDLLPGHFITLFAAAFHPASGRVRVVLAGHHRAWVVGKDGVRNVGHPGMAVGFPDTKLMRSTLTIDEFTLAPGEVLVQCSDGLLEATDSAVQEYGAERLADQLLRCPRAAQPTVDALADDLRHFAKGVIADDLTLLALSRGT